MKTILLCLNKLDIGGVETAVLNQTIELIRRKYRVVILADDGIYRQEFEKQGAIFIKLKYVYQNSCNKTILQKIMKIIDDYKVEQVHIHQFDCINPSFMACLYKKVPYVAYLHCGIMNVYDFFEKCIPCYRVIFSLYFHNASKIVAIRESAKKENINKYKVDSNKYIILKNSIDFNKFKVNDNKISTKIEKFLVISRLAKEKEISLINAITLFKKYYKINPQARLTIVGDGAIKEKIVKEIADIKDVTTMLGARKDIAKIMATQDIVVSLDRCILEAITMKKLAIISGYDGLKLLVTKKNIEKASNENFGGSNLENKTSDSLVNQLLKLDKKEIKNIVENNYKYAYENLNIRKNIFVFDNVKNDNIQLDHENVLDNFIMLLDMFNDYVKYADKVYNDCKHAEKGYQKQIEQQNIKIAELQRIYDKLKKFHLDKIYYKLKKIKSFFVFNKK